MSWFPLHCHSHFSLLDGLSKPEQIAGRIAECGFEGCAISDHGVISGVPPFIKAMQTVCKNCGQTKNAHSQTNRCQKYEAAKLRAIAGCEFYLCQQSPKLREVSNSKLSHLVVLANGLDGWKNMMRASSASFHPDHFYRKPRLDLETLASFSKGTFLTFSGHMGSDLANVIFEEPRLAYGATTVEEAKGLAKKNWTQEVFDLIDKYQTLFGKENFWVEIQLIDRANLPAAEVVAQGLRWCAKKKGVPCVATADSHYCRKEDAADQRILLCSAMDTTMNEVQRKLDADEEVGLGAFFRSNNYHIPSLKEMEEIHTSEELANSCLIASRCQPFSVGAPPRLPAFDCPQGKAPDEYLRELCRVGWAEKIPAAMKKSRKPKKSYQNQTKKELDVLMGAGLASYFLIVQDYCRHAREVMKCRVGKGRGSGAGCLVSYLIGITSVDPIRFDLLFERFYNAGRNSPGRVALPDIDSDFPISRREEVITYCRQKYGDQRVCQMATFSRMQGRGALKDVLRAHERCSFEEMNKITEHVPDEAEISDQLQEMREETGDASIIRWALENNKEQLKPWCVLKEDGTLDGPLALDFAQAMRLEGTKRSQGKHASGVIISGVDLPEVCPMVYDRATGDMLVGVDYRDAEDMGLVKFDILGVAILDKVMMSEQLVRTGHT